MVTITELVERSHGLAKEKGWYEGQQWEDGRVKAHAVNVPEKIALMHSELSEALEEYRKHGVRKRCECGTGCSLCVDGFQEIYFIDGKPESVVTELADVVIRIADFCGAMGLDLAKAIETKHRTNVDRPYRHGGKRA